MNTPVPGLRFNYYGNEVSAVMQELEQLIQSRLVQSRRGWLAMAAGALVSWSPVYGYASQDFWNKKDPDQWSPDEIKKLVTRSPWAKEVSAEKVTTKKSQNLREPKLGKTRTRLPGTVEPSGAPTERTVTSYRGTVAWESAAPIRAADKTPPPEEFADMYVLSVGGVPLAKGRASRAALDRLRQVTTLEMKGRDPLEAAVAQQISENGSVFFFGFARKALEISKDEKDVTFVTHLNKLRFAAKFNPREMLYRGELAV